MAFIGATLLGQLSKTDAEKLIRPWWDNLEDFVLYGIITLGLIVSPSQVFSGASLSCTLCVSAELCGGNRTSSQDPGYRQEYVNKYCVQNAISQFTKYFPYILLFLPLVLVGIERFFNRLFMANTQIQGLTDLIDNDNKRDELDEITFNDNVDDTVQTVEVRQSFKEQGSFYKNYALRTLFEFLVSALFSIYLGMFGMIEIQKEFEIVCQVQQSFFSCSGVPIEFYLYILLISLALLFVYILSTFFTLTWLLCPCTGSLAAFMRDYENLLRKSAETTFGEKNEFDREELLGDMNAIYYENNDLRLLLDLMTATSGLARPIRVMALLDRNFRVKCSPVIIQMERQADIQDGEGDLIVEITESDLARNVFGRMKALSKIYTVQLTPRTDNSKLEVVYFEPPEDRDRKISQKFMNLFQRNDKPIPESFPSKKISFVGADPNIGYSVKVSLIINGQAIAVAQHSLKPLIDPDTQAEQDAKNSALAARLSSAASHVHHRHKHHHRLHNNNKQSLLQVQEE